MAGRYAGTARPNYRRVYSEREGRVRNRRSYEDGSAVRVLDDYDYEQEYRPRRSAPSSGRNQRRSSAQRRAVEARAQRSLKKRTKRARSLARSMSAGYVAVLAAVCIISLVLCIHYLQLRSQVIHQNETAAQMETTLNRLKADNDALENQTQASLNLEEIKDTALHKLGLHYATESQIRYYNADNESYVRQYRPVSED